MRNNPTGNIVKKDLTVDLDDSAALDMMEYNEFTKTMNTNPFTSSNNLSHKLLPNPKKVQSAGLKPVSKKMVS